MMASTSGQVEGDNSTLNEVLQMPSLLRYLLSIRAITSNGGKVNYIFEGHKMIISKEGKNIVQGETKEHGLYKL